MNKLKQKKRSLTNEKVVAGNAKKYITERE